MQCKFKNNQEKQCSANAVKDSQYCFFHDKDNEKQRKLAQSKGGKANLIAVKDPLPPMPIANVQDVLGLLEDTVNRVRTGELDVKIGNCIGFLSGHLIRAFEVTSIANRVEIIEQAIFEKRTRIS
jgi:hypothetical protein